MDLNAEAPVQASLEVIEIVIGHDATRGCVSLRSTHSRRNTRCYPLPASPCVLGPRREWIERSETRNDWDRQTALGMPLLSVPICAAHRSQYSGVVLRSCPPPEYLAA